MERFIYNFIYLLMTIGENMNNRLSAILSGTPVKELDRLYASSKEYLRSLSNGSYYDEAIAALMKRGLSRREAMIFLVASGALSREFLSARQVSSADSEDKYNVHLSPVLLKNDLKEERKAPPWLPPGAGGGGFMHHIGRSGYGVAVEGPGLDLRPIARKTEIVPCMSGYVTRTHDKTPSGMIVRIVHPFGYLTLYAHLAARRVEPQVFLERDHVFAEMGNSGPRSKGIEHLHLTLFGPAYTKFFTGIEKFRTRIGPYALDPWDFSIAGMKEQDLPYQRPEDKAIDELLQRKHFEAQAYMDGLLSQFPRSEVERIYIIGNKEVEKSIEDLRRKYGRRPVDREIAFVYSRIIEDNHPFSRNDIEGILKELRRFMLIVPRLTAPIKEPGKDEFYRYLPFERVEYKA